LWKFRVRVDRDAAAIVGDGEGAVGGEVHLDEAGMPGQRLVHGVVDHLGEQVMQRFLIGARRYTFRAAGAPARALPAPRCRGAV